MPEEKETLLQKIIEDLRDLERFIEEFLTFLPLAVCTVNPLGIITHINQAFVKLTGFDEIEIVGEKIESLFLEKEKIKDLEKRIFKKELIKEEEATLISKEKERIPVSLSASFREDEEGNFIGYFLAISDIRDFKRLQESLEEKVRERTKSLEQSRTALLNILEDVQEAREKAEEEKNKTLAIIINFTDGLLVFDKTNRISLVNPQAENFFGIEAKKIIGKSLSELKDFLFFKPLLNLLEKKTDGIFKKELFFKENLILEVSSVPIIRKKERLGDLVILHDITREKRVERMKTEFVSLAAHQLRTPLSAIKWTLKMFLEGDIGEITKEQKEFIKKIYQANERMISLINDLLDVTRIEEGRYLTRVSLANIKEIVQLVINSFREEIKKRKIKFEFKEPLEKLPQILLDVEKIKLAIENLLDNAIRYTPPEGKVTISLKSDINKIEFSIKDSGIGIPEDEKERIFTKFFRGSNVKRLETEGSGLGLFITKNIIEAHGGKIWFESKEGVGTTFYFTLPLKTEITQSFKKS
jgi:PAS domain S-box-containing protein